MLNDKYETIEAGTVKATIKSGGKTVELGKWDFGTIEPNKNLEGPKEEVNLPDFELQKMTLLLEVVGHPEWNSSYDLLFVK